MLMTVYQHSWSWKVLKLQFIIHWCAVFSVLRLMWFCSLLWGGDTWMVENNHWPLTINLLRLRTRLLFVEQSNMLHHITVYYKCITRYFIVLHFISKMDISFSIFDTLCNIYFPVELTLCNTWSRRNTLCWNMPNCAPVSNYILILILLSNI